MSAIAECVVAFIFGSVVGLLVQRSRFCNTAALRDAILFKSYRNTKALLLAMMMFLRMSWPMTTSPSSRELTLRGMPK